MPSNKKFGIFFSIVFFACSIYFLYNNSNIYFLCFLSFSITFLLLTVFFSNLLSPFNLAWMKLGLLLGKIFNPLILGILFFILLTPTGILSRLIGRDTLKTKKKYNSLWIKKEKINDFNQYFKQQF